MIKERFNILVELDALFDTRLSLYYKLLGEDVKDILKEGYINRIYDRFDNIIGRDIFLDNYKNRDKSLLEDTTITRIVSFIQDVLVSKKLESIDDNTIIDVNVIINAFPYNLSDSEVNIILRSLKKAIEIDGVKYRMINKSFENLTPQYINDHIDLMIYYDAERWLQVHREETKIFDTVSCTSVGLVAPRLITQKHQDYKSWLKSQTTDPFRLYEFITGPSISLNFIPAKIFSTVSID